MNFRRVAILLRMEFVHGIRSFFFFQAILTPLLMTVVINLIFGSVFTGKPRLGLQHVDDEIYRLALTDSTITVRNYTDENSLRQAVESGAVDAGILLQDGFIENLTAGRSPTLTTFIWGESRLLDRGTIEATVELGRGLSETPNLHTGDIPDEGVKTFLQTSTGAIMEVPEVNLPLPNSKTARTSWEEVSK